MSIIIQGTYNLEIQELAGRVTDEQLFEICQANRNVKIERDKDGNLIIMAPVGPESGYFEGELVYYLKQWNKENQTGIVFSPSTGYILPNTAMRAPDASWVPNEKWQTIKNRPGKGFPHICPDFLAEIRSSTDSLEKMKHKMEEWIDNGARLAWLIDPGEEKAYVYRADGSTEVVEGFDKQLSGEDVLTGFILELKVFRLP